MSNNIKVTTSVNLTADNGKSIKRGARGRLIGESRQGKYIIQFAGAVAEMDGKNIIIL